MSKKLIASAALLAGAVVVLIIMFSVINIKDQSASSNLSGGAQEANSLLTPAGFNEVLFANGLTAPTALAFAPDGRLFVTLQGGQVRVIKNNALLPTPFYTASVNSSGERGLNGIAFDPNFATNHYVYIYYTLSSGANNRLIRVTANGDVAIPGSELTLLDLDPLNGASYHMGGALVFGTDGKLYIGVGDASTSANGQNTNTNLGKVLRINSDGTIPVNNPYTTGTTQHKQIWVAGMRNPFTLSVNTANGKIFANDVGGNLWEEINDITAGGGNYGWPITEGVANNPLYVDPVYAYANTQNGGPGCAITGGAFYNPATVSFPASYIGKYFFLDYCGNWLDTLDLSGPTPVDTNFMTGVGNGPLGLTTGPDGNLYLISHGSDEVYKITYTSNGAPVINTPPQNITVGAGSGAAFSVIASGTAPLAYQWKKNGTNISGATTATYTISSTQVSDAGTYSVTVTNSIGSITSMGATLTVTVANQSPTAYVTSPAIGATYAAGTTINFTGIGTDPEDGTLPAAAYSWSVVFHHNVHTHPGPSISGSGSSGSFVIPNIGETATDVWYRLHLTVTDSLGATDTSFIDILPRTSIISLQTNPAGNQVTLDSQPFTAPYTVTSVEGMMRTLGVTVPGGYIFSNWSNGGSQTQTIMTPVNDTTYTATLTPGITPTIIITSPINNATVSGTVPLIVSITGSGITSVKYYKNTSNTLIGTATTSPFTYNWNTTLKPNNTFNVVAKAYAGTTLVTTSPINKIKVLNVVYQCNDTLDNDGDTLIDYPSDSGCTSTTDNDEVNVDTTPPVLSAIGASSITASGAIVSWTTNELGDTQVVYGTSASYGTTFPPTPLTSMTLNHSLNISSLAANTIYHYAVKSRDASNNLATSLDQTFTTASGPDTIFPTVTLTAPSAGATLSGTVTLAANATDNVGVIKVEFYGDAGILLATDTVAPYSYSWNTVGSANGSHTLYAKAYDAVPNITTTSPISITINNGTNNPPVVWAGNPNTVPKNAGGVIMWGATVTDTDGPTPLTIQWTKISGPGTVTWTNPSLPQSGVSFSLIGQYVMRLTATDGAGASAYSQTMWDVTN